MMDCACGRSFVPDVEMYVAHRETPEHVEFTARVVDDREGPAENVPRFVPAIYRCRCGHMHMADTIQGRAHMALGMVTA